MFIDPITEEFIGSTDPNAVGIELFDLKRLDPGFEALSVEILLDDCQARLPEEGRIVRHGANLTYPR